jgi:hypothetical protein
MFLCPDLRICMSFRSFSQGLSWVDPARPWRSVRPAVIGEPPSGGWLGGRSAVQVHDVHDVIQNGFEPHPGFLIRKSVRVREANAACIDLDPPPDPRPAARRVYLYCGQASDGFM